MDSRVLLRWPARTLFTLGFLLMGVSTQDVTAVRAFRSADTRREEAARPAPAHMLSKTPWCPATLEIGVFGRIEIPRLGISALITEGAGTAQLNLTVGHVETTVFPGQPGNCALAGHRDSFLRGLGDVREHDVILIDTLQGTYTYRVEWGRVVGPRRAGVLDTTAVPSLTLVTCYPFHVEDPAAERFVVRATLVEPALAAR
jgi:LPXTG-site transpeptidase (sortase) family protein